MTWIEYCFNIYLIRFLDVYLVFTLDLQNKSQEDGKGSLRNFFLIQFYENIKSDIYFKGVDTYSLVLRIMRMELGKF